jgi:hypothetical protein
LRVEEWDLPSIGLRNLSAAERRAFWDRYAALRREVRYRWGNTFSRWREVPGTNLNISVYITNHSVGLFVRGERGASLSSTRAILASRAGELEQALDARLDDEAPLLRSLPLATTDPATWARAYEWLAEREADYLAALASRADL